jgi:hypothetical protein
MTTLSDESAKKRIVEEQSRRSDGKRKRKGGSKKNVTTMTRFPKPRHLSRNKNLEAMVQMEAQTRTRQTADTMPHDRLRPHQY